MFDDIPDAYRNQTADNEDEGWRYTQGDKKRTASARAADARSRRALHHARGEGRTRQPARRRLPRHRVDQEEAAGRRGASSSASCRACITSSRSWPTSTSRRSRWRSARRRTTSWAACAWTRDTQMSTIPGLFAAGECAAGINGANRLGGNSLSDLLVFGKRAGEYAAKFARAEPARRDRSGPRRRTATDGGAEAVRADRAARTRTPCRRRCRK